MAPVFQTALIQKMRESARNDHHDNWDSTIRGAEIAPAPHGKPVEEMLAEFEGIGFLYDRLEDQQSRDLLVELCAFRALGHRKVKLTRNTQAYRAGFETVERLHAEGSFRFPFPLFQIDHFELACRDLSPLGYDIRAYCTTFGGSIIFIQKQYELHRGRVVCKAEPGDIVIEAGACWGDTALYFAHEVGPTGRVFAFEFIPTNIAVFFKNLDANPRLRDSIELIEKPLWRRSGDQLHFIDSGPASRMVPSTRQDDPSVSICETIAIDDLVGEKALERVDFIKMDIEGAEIEALKGAEMTIRRFQPKLAISLYHSLADFSRIPRFIDSLGLPYRFYLEHHTIFEGETVLFAVPVR